MQAGAWRVGRKGARRSCYDDNHSREERHHRDLLDLLEVPAGACCSTFTFTFTFTAMQVKTAQVRHTDKPSCAGLG